jgi:plastocyanin
MERFIKLTLVAILGAGLAACGGGGGGGSTEGGATPATEGGTQAESPVDAATAGSISGQVAFTGTAPENEAIDMSGEADCASQYTDQPRQETVVVNANGTLANVLVYVKKGLEGMTFPVPTDPVTLDQKGCRYHPHVLALQVGQPLNVLNSDTVLHNIHPKPKENRAFNESQPKQGMQFTKTFSKPEIMVPIGCDVHDWMNASLGVLEHPYFAVTDDSGAFSLPNLPPGTYTLAAWHEKYGEMTQDVTLGEKEAKTVDFSFSG